MSVTGSEGHLGSRKVSRAARDRSRERVMSGASFELTADARPNETGGVAVAAIRQVAGQSSRYINYLELLLEVPDWLERCPSYDQHHLLHLDLLEQSVLRRRSTPSTR